MQTLYKQRLIQANDFDEGYLPKTRDMARPPRKVKVEKPRKVKRQREHSGIL